MKEHKNSIYFPLLLNLQKFPCLVIGGGEVAQRKVQSLLEFSKEITVISPDICKPLLDLNKENKIQIILKSYSKEYLKNFKLVFCATDNNETNKIVYNDCEEQGILLNVVDIPHLCDFILPANVKRGDLTISVASQGKAPFLVKVIKHKLENIFSNSFSEILDLAGNFRKKLLENVKDKSPELKEKAFKKFIEIDWEKVLKEKGKEKTYKYMQSILNEFY